MRQGTGIIRGVVGAVAAVIVVPGMVTGEIVLSQGRGDAGNVAPRVGSQPIEHSKLRLGVSVENASLEGGGTPQAGAIVRDVTRDSGAEKAGLQGGDVIVEFDGERVLNAAQLTRLVDKTPFGRTIRIRVLRQGKWLDLNVTLDVGQMVRGLAPLVMTPVREGPYIRMLPRGGAERLGVTVHDIAPQLAEYFGIRKGVLIASVRPWSSSDQAGLRAGDAVTSVDGIAVGTVADLARALHRDLTGAELSVTVTRERQHLMIEVKVRRPE